MGRPRPFSSLFRSFDPANAAKRKSLRWATSAVGSYGYMVAASMTRIVEAALGGEYTVTVQPYTSPTVSMKAVMDGNGEISYTADIGMAEFHQRVGGFKGYQPKMPEIVHTWYAYPMESMMAVAAKNADKFKCWRDFSGKPVFYTNAGFMNWLNMHARLQGARLQLQARPDRPQVERGRDAVRYHSGVGRLHHRRPLAPRLLEGNRDLAWTSGS